MLRMVITMVVICKINKKGQLIDIKEISDLFRYKKNNLDKK